MDEWRNTLPSDIQALLEVREDELGDYSAAVKQQTVISRLAYRRAVQAVAVESLTPEQVAEMAWQPDALAGRLNPNDVTKIVEVASKANKTLVDMKTTRLDAQEKFKDKARDNGLKPLNINFYRAETSPSLLVQKLLILGRRDEAMQTAKDAGLDWEQFESPYVEH